MPSRPVDLLLAFVGWFLVTFAPVTYVVDLLLSPEGVTTTVDAGATGLVAGVLALWYWWTDRSVGALGAFFFWSVAFSLAVGAAVMVVLGAFDAAPVTGTTESSLVSLAFFGVVYAGAAAVAFGDGRARMRDLLGTDAETTLCDDNE